MERKKLIIILLTITIIFTIIGGSLAYWNWQTSTEQQTAVTFTVTSDFSCAADGGGDITSSDVALAPCECTNSKYAIKREVKVMPTINGVGKTVYMDLWLNINELGTGLSNSDNFRYALTTSSDSCENAIVSGTFKGLTTGDKIELLTSKTYTTTMTDTYYLWIWLDKEETSTDTMNQTVNLSLGGSCIDTKLPNDPDVPAGMIPVTIANDGTVTTVSEEDESWYDYDNKLWANAVLVSETNRSTYQDSAGVTIPEDDILAYYVWIPRYKYKIWTTGTSSAEQEQEIDIVFESIDEISTGTQVGEYLTHPAFWWDSDSDGVREEGEELSGIWVGKFETSTDTSSTCYTSASSSNCNNTEQSPRIKPNVPSLRNQNVSTQFQTILKFSGGTLSDGIVTFAGSDDTYGLSSTTNSHMLKNSEWGAVAYLSHSKYGIGTETRINNNISFTTGCGASTANAGSISSCEIAYGSGVTEYPQSTTGNITGIFDMSGGAWEYVMGNYNGTIGYSGFSTLPESKYYDKYTTTSALTACNGGICYGHALSETSGWYSDYAYFVSSRSPWFLRGGDYHNGASAGAFTFYDSYGDANFNYGVRAALLPDGA